MNISRTDIQSLGVPFVFRDVFKSRFLGSLTFAFSLLYNFIIYVGIILNKFYVEPPKLQITPKDVEYAYRAGVSYMNIIINRRTAYIYTCFSLVYRLKLLFSAGQCIVYFHLCDSFHSLFSLFLSGLFIVLLTITAVSIPAMVSSIRETAKR